MGNRSKFVAVGGLATAGLLLRRRRARLRAVAKGIGEAILPTAVAETERAMVLDAGPGDGHAPGHQHLARPRSRWPRGRRGHRARGDRPYARD